MNNSYLCDLVSNRLFCSFHRTKEIVFKMNLNDKTSSVAVLALLDLLKDNGISFEKINQKTGITISKMNNPDLTISQHQLIKLWDFSKEISGNPALGLHLRRQYGRNFMHFVISLAKNSETLFEAASLWCRFARVICESDRIELIKENNNYILVHTNLHPHYKCISMTEHDIVHAVEYGRSFTGKKFNPVEVRFVHPAPEYKDEYSKIFRCPVFFGREENGVVLKKKDLQREIMTRDHHLQATLKKHAESIMSQLSDSESFKIKIERYIIKNLPKGKVDVESVCGYMNMSRSTLHRRLKQEETTFSELLENTRKSLSNTYLKHDMSLTQIAFLLGFSEPSTFQHAFRRWYNKSPGEFRKRL